MDAVGLVCNQCSNIYACGASPSLLPLPSPSSAPPRHAECTFSRSLIISETTKTRIEFRSLAVAATHTKNNRPCLTAGISSAPTRYVRIQWVSAPTLSHFLFKDNNPSSDIVPLFSNLHVLRLRLSCFLFSPGREPLFSPFYFLLQLVKREMILFVSVQVGWLSGGSWPPFLLVTSSVTYCNPPETLLIQRFEVAFFPSNSSVSFNVSAASVVCVSPMGPYC